MTKYGRTWMMLGITVGLAVGAVFLFIGAYAYAETTHDPDAIEAPVFFVSLFLLFLAAVGIPVTIRTWLFEKERNDRIKLSLG